MLTRRLALGISLLLNATLFYNLIWGESGAISYNELRERCKTLEERISRTKEENIALSKEIRLLQSDEKYIEKMIRNRLNFVRANEILYIFQGSARSGSSGVLPNEAKD